MGKLEQRFFIAYLAWVIVELFMQLVKDSYPLAHGIVKSGLMPILIGLVLFTAKFTNVKIRLLLLASLVFAWAGDVLLLFDDPNLNYDREFYFKAGLGSFFMAQVLYIFIFSLHSKKNNKRALVLRRPIILLVMLLVTGIILFEIRETAEDLLIPVLAYTFALLGMVISALNRRGRTNDVSFYLVVFGAFSFLLSDTLIAFDHFHTPIDGMYVMATYMFAQGMIVMGLLFHKDRFVEELNTPLITPD